MKLEEVLPALRVGKRIKRTIWDYWIDLNYPLEWIRDNEDILADDWEISDET